ncbi:hypothetical protein V8C35DRAFT_294240 [Trichoderma chlorosporum]
MSSLTYSKALLFSFPSIPSIFITIMTKASPTLTEIVNTVKDTIHSLQPHSDDDSVRFLNLVLRILLRAIANFGKALPKELQWCRKLPTIAALDESIPIEHQSPSNTTQDNSSATQDTPNAERYPTLDTTAQDDASATQDTSNAERYPTLDTTAQDDASATQATPDAERCATPDNTAQDHASATQDETLSLGDVMAQELVEMAPEFENWAANPASFWEYSTQSLCLQELTLNERLKSFCKHAAEELSGAMVQTYMRNFDSLIIYIWYRKLYPRINRLILSKVQKFLDRLGLSTDKAALEKYLKLLYRGKRCLQFCFALSKDNVKSSTYPHNDFNFEDVDYGFLFLPVDNRMWKKGTYYQSIFHDTLDKIPSRKIRTASELSGARHAGKTLLQSRLAYIQELPSSSDNNGPKTKIGSKRSSTEADIVSPAASKRSRTSGESESCLDILIQAVEMSQTAPASETNPDPNPYIVPYNALSSDSQNSGTNLEQSFQNANLASRPRGSEDINMITLEAIPT